MNALGDFPVDDLTLDAVEHALGYHLDHDYSEDADSDFPFKGTGADYSLSKLLDFYSGTVDNEGVVQLPESEWINRTPTFLDERDHYQEKDVISALIAEVRRLRDECS